MRVFDELRGSLASLRCAAKRSSGGTDMSSVVAFSAARRAAYCATIFSRFLFRLIWLNFAMRVPSQLVDERKLKALEERFRFRVRPGGRIDDDIHAPDILSLVVVDLDEDDVFLEAQRVVAVAVEALSVQTAEIAHAWQRHRHQPVEEFVHAVA